MSYDTLIDELVSLSHADSSESKTAAALELVLDGDVDELQLLLQSERECTTSGLRVNARNPNSGRALLHEACAEGNLEIVKFLPEKTDADLALRTMLGRSTRLRLAVTNNHRAVVFLLLSYGADAPSRDRFGCSPMHYVKSLNVAKLLIQYGGKVLDYNSVSVSQGSVVSPEVLIHEAQERARERADLCRERQRRERRHSQKFPKVPKCQVELEYKSKLEKLRQLKKRQKSSSAAVNSGDKSSPGKKYRKKHNAAL